MKTESLVIMAGARTPFGRVGTVLSEPDAVDLGRAAVSGLLIRTGIDPAEVDETILGSVGQPAEAPNLARVVALRAGIPQDKPAMTVQRNCASGLQSIVSASEKMAAGHGRLFVVGGVESMSHMPLQFRYEAALKFAILARARTLGSKVSGMSAFRLKDFLPLMTLKMGLTDPIAELNMGETAEILARELNISREAQDAFAARSHLRAAAHRAELGDELIPVFAGTRSPKAVAADNGIRADISLDRLAKLHPVFDSLMGSVTAGNSSQISDGAVALLVGSEEQARALDLQPLGRLVSSAWSGCDPARMGLGPVKASAMALEEAGWSLDDVDVVEINEAFAAQTLSVLKCFKDEKAARYAGLNKAVGELDDNRLNAQGGAIALGHPVGATGARLVYTALMQLRRSGKKRALVMLCVGGGQGGAVCLEAF